LEETIFGLPGRWRKKYHTASLLDILQIDFAALNSENDALISLVDE